MMLYGASLLYGFSGTVSFEGIAAVVSHSAPIGVILVSFSFWRVSRSNVGGALPYVDARCLRGAPTPVTAFFASSAKVAAVAITARIVLTAFPGVIGQWRQIVVFLAVVSTLLGSFAAIGQTNIKRLMAYSSIGTWASC